MLQQGPQAKAPLIADHSLMAVDAQSAMGAAWYGEVDHCIQSLRMAAQGDEGGQQTEALFIVGVEPLDGQLPLPNVRAG
jgi:hypothetical protein